MRKLLALLLVLLLCVTTTACQPTETTPAPTAPNNANTAYPDKTVGFQLEAPEKGEQIAIMHTSMGDIYIRFFPEAAPKAVENFVTHSKNGYYNGLTFHRVIEDFMIQGGDPNGTGMGGNSIWGKSFEDEFDSKLLNLRGSLAMANSGVNTNGSQFFINQAGPDAFEQSIVKSFATYEEFSSFCRENVNRIEEWKKQYAELVQSQGQAAVESMYGTLDACISNMMSQLAQQSALYYFTNTPEKAVWDAYTQYGGNLTLDGAWRYQGGHTVFGQVFKGMDVVDAIAAVEVNSSSKPLTAVTITSIEITTYQG